MSKHLFVKRVVSSGASLDEVYALFRDDIKDEVPAGKGEGPTAAGLKRVHRHIIDWDAGRGTQGKGMNFVKTKFGQIDETEPLGCVQLDVGSTGNATWRAGRKSTWRRRQT